MDWGQGEITVNYKNGKPDCFSVDFEDDFDVFDGLGWGCFGWNDSICFSVRKGVKNESKRIR